MVSISGVFNGLFTPNKTAMLKNWDVKRFNSHISSLKPIQNIYLHFATKPNNGKKIIIATQSFKRVSFHSDQMEIGNQQGDSSKRNVAMDNIV